MAASTKSLNLSRASGQYVKIADGSQTQLEPATNWTFETWLKPVSVPANNGDTFFIYGKDNGTQRQFFFQYEKAAGAFLFSLAVWQSATAGDRDQFHWDYTMTANKWYHIAYNFNVANATATEAELFIGTESILPTSQGNGTIDVNTNISVIYNSTADVSLGAYGNDSSHFDGRFYETRVWNDVNRTQAELRANYKKSLVGNEANLRALWKWQDNLEDTTASNNDLTGDGTPTYSTDVPRWFDNAGVLLNFM